MIRRRQDASQLVQESQPCVSIARRIDQWREVQQRGFKQCIRLRVFPQTCQPVTLCGQRGSVSLLPFGVAQGPVLRCVAGCGRVPAPHLPRRVEIGDSRTAQRLDTVIAC